ncbi:MAG: hypothetical protein MUF43_07380 [Flavobacterium sp.]|jgi:hypothetical protein|nr:hypothetical protein [Flavobacterium sp.]
MDKSFVKSNIKNYHIKNLFLTVVVFFALNYFYEAESNYILIGTIVFNIIMVFFNPLHFFYDFKIENEEVTFVFINSYFLEESVTIPISKLKCYKIETSGYFNKQFEIIFFQDFNIEKFIIFDENQVFRIEKFCKSNAIKLKTGFLQ